MTRIPFFLFLRIVNKSSNHVDNCIGKWASLSICSHLLTPFWGTKKFNTDKAWLYATGRAGGWPSLFRSFAVGAWSLPVFGKGRGSGHPFGPAFDLVVVSSVDFRFF